SRQQQPSVVQLPHIHQILEGQPRQNAPSPVPYSRASEAAGDSRVLPFSPQQPPVPATTGQQQKRGREETNLSGTGDSAKKLRKENDKPLTQASEGTVQTQAMKGLKRKTGVKAKRKVEGEQAMAQLEDQSHWSDEDTKLLLETILGTESAFYEDLVGNAKHIFRKISVNIFKGRRSAESVKGRYERLRRVFSYILNFESITGNGGGDPDIEVLDEKIETARSAGKDVGNLSGATLKKWYQEGWYELFNDRLGEHPGLVREEEFRSGMLSDTLDISSEESSASDSSGEAKNGGTTKKPKTSRPAQKFTAEKKVKLNSQKGVPAPRHKRKVSQANVGNEAAEFFSSNVEFLKATAHGDSERLKLLKKREMREEKQHEFIVEKGRAEVSLAEREAKVKNAREMMIMDGIPDEVKAAARQVLLDYFTIAGPSQ
ncbi:hypothetical protein AZE42_12947, partial [Rhizopogon vesiculosus]